MQFRQFALSDLQRVVSMDDKDLDAQLLIGKLQSLPLGDAAAARRALSKVVDSKDATPDQKAEAYALRGAQQKDDERKLADMNKAVELQPKKPDYLRLRAQQLLRKGKVQRGARRCRQGAQNGTRTCRHERAARHDLAWTG